MKEGELEEKLMVKQAWGTGNRELNQRPAAEDHGTEARR